MIGRINLPQALAYLLLAPPTLGGLAVTLAAAFGYMPALGGATLSLDPFRRLIDAPGLAPGVMLTLGVGFASTLLALALAFALLYRVLARSGAGGLDLALTPLLASPHSAVAVGLAFLIAPSGWIARFVSLWAGWSEPPDVATTGDMLGLALTLGLVVKETPFLVAVGLAAFRPLAPQPQMRAARALGYAPATAFALVVAPQFYARMRLPVYAVLAYSLTVVDMAIVLAPSRPAPLSLMTLHWLTSPDLDALPLGEAAAALQLGLVIGALALWRLAEAGMGRMVRARAHTGARRGAAALATPALASAGALALALGLASLMGLAVWAFAWRWPFPHVWPQSFTLSLAWRATQGFGAPLGVTLALALAVSAAALALAVAWLEAEDRLARRADARLLLLPLLIPQIAFLIGAQSLLAAARLDGTLAAVALAHMLFVFPYVWLALADPWRALDPRYARAARALGAGRLAALFRVKLPILAGPLALAFAVGVAVSATQYLSTVFAGAGRVSTLTTEALALANGGDRRLSALLGLAQTLIPLTGYALALATPRVVFRHRRGLAGT